MKLLIATRNKGKIKEIEELFGATLHTLLNLNDFDAEDVPETGSTFEENAVLKATSYAIQTGHWAIADDSGLEVEALGNAPGVYSARYAGEDSSDEEKMSKILEELQLTLSANRRARYVCVVAVADPEGILRFTSKGICRGMIADSPSGAEGFGYDPIFTPEGRDQTFGELPMAEKQQISHRAVAIREIIAKIEKTDGLA